MIKPSHALLCAITAVSLCACVSPAQRAANAATSICGPQAAHMSSPDDQTKWHECFFSVMNGNMQQEMNRRQQAIDTITTNTAILNASPPPVQNVHIVP